MRFFGLFLLGLLCLTAPKVLASGLVLGAERSYMVGKNMGIYMDESRTMGIKDVSSIQSRFVAANDDVPYLGINNNIYWLKIELEKPKEAPNDWILLLDHTQFNYVDFYLKTDSSANWQEEKMSRLRPFRERMLPYPGFAVKLDFSKRNKQLIFIRIEGQRLKVVPLYVIRHSEQEKQNNIESTCYGLYFGILLGLFLYNAFLTVTLRDKSYLYYTLSILVTFLIFSNMSGKMCQYLLGDFAYIQPRVLETTSAFLIILPISFTQTFLNIKQHIKWLDYTYSTIKLLTIAALPLIMFSNDFFVETQYYYYTLLSIQTPLLLYAGIALWYKGEDYARYYVFAWFGYIVGGTLNLQRDLGFLPYSFWTTHGAEIGSALEAVLLSLALSSRYQRFRQEKEKATQHALAVQEEANRSLEQKVNERTLALSEANQDLLQLNEELASTLEIVNVQKDEIAHQQEQIVSSINYAQRIQKAILPTLDEIASHFKHFFVLFKPRDVVSGDFYYCQQIQGNIILAVIDCTGHGVPGAFMSLVANDLLNEIILGRGVTAPHLIIANLHKAVRKTLRQADSKNHDGLDLVLLSVDKNKQSVAFAGAKNPLYYVQDTVLHIIKGDKMPVGGEQREKERFFTQHDLQIQAPTTFYLATDGYPDQFGGPKGRKFLSKNFRELLLEVSLEPLEEQKKMLDERLVAWQKGGTMPQTDDILVVGFKLESNNA